MPENLNKDSYNIDDALKFVNSVIVNEQEELENLGRRFAVLSNDIKILKDEINVIDDKTDASFSVFSTIVSPEQHRKSEAERKLENVRTEISEIEKLIKIKKEKIYKFKNVNHFLESSLNVEQEDTSDSAAGIEILKTQEEERSRIARDLHDSITQSLTNLVYRAELSTRLLDMDIVRARLELIAMTESMRGCINEMRDIIYNLRPMALDDLGLNEAVKRYIDGIKKNHGIQTAVCMDAEEPENIPSIIKITIYRVIQEAVNNAVKHSEADTIILHTKYNNNSIAVEVYDNGLGFDVSEVFSKKSGLKNGHGLGMSTMKERVLLLSGEFDIESQPGKGTKVKFVIPLK